MTTTTVRVRRVTQVVRVRRAPSEGGPRVRRVEQTVRTRAGSGTTTTVRVRRAVQVARIRASVPTTVRVRKAVTTARVRSGAGSGSVATHAATHLPGGSDPLPLSQPRPLEIENPTGSEKFVWFRTYRQRTVNEINVVLLGGAAFPSVGFGIRFAADVTDVGTELLTGGRTETNATTGTSYAPDVAIIPADVWVWFETTSQSGTVPELSLTMDLDP